MAIRKIKAALVNTRDATDYSTEIGYLFYDADPNGDRTLRISDGSTPGGIPLLASSSSGDSSTGIAQAQLKVADDSSSSTTFDLGGTGETLKIAGGTNLSTSISGDTLTLNLNSDLQVNNLSGLDSSGINVNDNLYVNGASVLTSGSNVSELTNDANYLTQARLTVVGDDSTGTTFNAGNNDNIRVLGTGGTTVTVSGSTVIINSADSTGGSGRATYTQDNAPASPVDGDTWLKTDTGALYVYIVEGGYAQWIETGSAGSTLDVDGVDSIRFAADDSTSTAVGTSETLSIVGGDGIQTAVTGTGEIRISSTGSSVSTSDSKPSSAADGDLWFETDTGSLYVYVVEGSSANWIETGSSGSGGPTNHVQDNAPSSPSNGDLWYDTNEGSLYIYVVEGSKSYWVETGGSGASGGGGITSVSADSSPTLGGNLNANSNNITNIATLSIATNGNPGSDPATDSGVGYLYAKGATAELFVKDGSGNITQISPHSNEGDWVYYSENVKTGKKVKVNMEKMIRRLEEITGESFFEIYEPHKIKY